MRRRGAGCGGVGPDAGKGPIAGRLSWRWVSALACAGEGAADGCTGSVAALPAPSPAGLAATGGAGSARVRLGGTAGRGVLRCDGEDDDDDDGAAEGLAAASARSRHKRSK